MRIHITNIYGMTGTAIKCQHMVANIVKTFFHFNELSIYHFRANSDSKEKFANRLDGIMASVSYKDLDNIVIFQFPTWNGIAFDEALVRQLKTHRRLKTIFFIHDVTPLMFEQNRYLLNRYVDLYNQADLIILPSQAMVDFLRSEGMRVSKVIVQKMWDSMISIDDGIIPQFRRVFNFAGNTNEEKFSFVKNWKYNSVKLAVTAEESDWNSKENIVFMGWFDNQNLLAETLRKNGGFGLLWTEDSLWGNYMKLNACDKLSLYLASGIPVVVHSSIPAAGTILNNKLGIVVDSLNEAVDRVEHMREEQYNQMVNEIGIYGELLRQGYFTKKIMIDAVFKLLYE